ncbi:hypothetical protein GCM10008171_00490 [Methylopila jiangsuensis]|uniref:Uncharacterized protein n=2 Tax=Methylopila jiangsuensis TaxID=586230 RepID=A0A9W6JD34_9HYPH|nr:hypothetical protein GCM10008171_00490 [Methylopila jiangsuensis]
MAAMEREKIIRDNYPVERLPEDLRAGLDAGARVKVTVEGPASGLDSFRARVRELQNAGLLKVETLEETTRRTRALRDEWDR